MILRPRPHQAAAIDALLDEPFCALFAKPGSGKTAIILSVLKILYSLGLMRRTLIVAPLQTCLSTWPDEIAKWTQFGFFDWAFAHGARKDDTDHTLVFITPQRAGRLTLKDVKGFDTLVVDESTAFQNWSAKRTKSLRKLVPHFKRRHIMTGTPTANSLLSWFAQQYLVDAGASFGKFITHFKREHGRPVGYKQYGWEPHPGTLERLTALSARHVHVAEPDDSEIPDVEFVDRFVTLPDSVVTQYKSMQRQLFAQLSAETVTAVSSGVAWGKCRQIAAGALYKPDGTAEELHTEKVIACKRIIDELNGAPVMVLYHRTFEVEMLKKQIGSEGVEVLNGSTPQKDRSKIIDRWNAGKVRVLIMHPQTGAHGLNLHIGGCHTIWLTLPDDAERYEQANRRMRRLMAERKVTIYRIVMRGTVERVVLRRLESRCSLQDALLEYAAGYGM